LFDGVALQAKDINAVAMDALSDDYSPQKWTADATALWINGASIWFNALFGVPVTDDDDDDNP
jgi:hypothetical protein